MDAVAKPKPKNETSLTIAAGRYLLSVDARRTRIPCKTKLWEGDRIVGEREFFVPMLQSKVSLLHESGDMITFTMTAMGSKVGCTKTTTMPRGTVRSKIATGPADIETGTKPESVKMAMVTATIHRMTGLPLTEVDMLFRVEALLARENAEAA
jgi:hypothetical protein